MFDWFTFVAQIVNFLVLVWLLKKFLYGPIVEAMDNREREIASILEKGKEEVEQAKARKQLLDTKLSELDTVRERRLVEIEEEVELTRADLLKQARDQVRLTEKSWKDSIEEEKVRFNDQFKTKAQLEILKVARKAIGDLADKGLEKQIFEVCLTRLKSNSCQLILAGTGLKSVRVRTAFPLDGSERKEIEELLETVLGVKGEIEFETTEKLIAGVELVVNGHKVTWSISDYLNKLEINI